MSMNNVEALTFERYEKKGLRRINGNAKPCEVTIVIPRNHNPDFKLFEPERGAGLYIEVKGHIRSSTWMPMLKEAPDSFKRVYRVLLVHSSAKYANNIGKSLTSSGIIWYHTSLTNPEIPSWWLEDAAKLYLSNRHNATYDWHKKMA